MYKIAFPVIKKILKYGVVLLNNVNYKFVPININAEVLITTRKNGK